MHTLGACPAINILTFFGKLCCHDIFLVISAPSPVASVTISSKNSTSVDISWSAASGYVDGYSYTASIGGAGQLESSAVGTSGSFTGLTPGALYTITVRSYVTGSNGRIFSAMTSENVILCKFNDIALFLNKCMSSLFFIFQVSV